MKKWINEPEEVGPPCSLSKAIANGDILAFRQGLETIDPDKQYYETKLAVRRALRGGAVDFCQQIMDFINLSKRDLLDCLGVAARYGRLSFIDAIIENSQGIFSPEEIKRVSQQTRSDDKATQTYLEGLLTASFAERLRPRREKVFAPNFDKLKGPGAKKSGLASLDC